MAIRFKASPSNAIEQVLTPLKRKSTGHTRPRPPTIDMYAPGRVRVANLMALLDVSHSTLYKRIADGKFPEPDDRDGRIPFWYTSTILPLVTKNEG